MEDKKILFPTFRRIFKTDYPQDQQELVEKLSVSINNGLEVVYNAMSHNVSLTDNMFCSVNIIRTQANSSGVPTTPLSFKITTTGIIKGNQVIQARNITNPLVAVTSQPFLTYSQNDTQINVSNVTGLPVGNVFELTVITWG